MKFSKLSQLFLVSTIGLSVATLLTSCAIDTIDYVFVANSAGPGPAAPDRSRPTMRTPEPARCASGSRPSPAAETTPSPWPSTSDYANLYVVNQGSNNSVVHFDIAGNGVLTQEDGHHQRHACCRRRQHRRRPISMCVSGPSPTQLTTYALSNGIIGSAGPGGQQTINLPSPYGGDVLIPTGVTVLANNTVITGNAVYVTVYDQTAYNPGGSTNPAPPTPAGSSAIPSAREALYRASSNSPYLAGVKPTAIASTPTNEYVYVTDYASSELIGYSVRDGVNLVFLINGPFRTGTEPQAVVIDPRGKYMYVANSLTTRSPPSSLTLAPARLRWSQTPATQQTPSL